MIVTADHGEGFLEHDAVGHGYTLFDTTVHIPMIIAGPGIPGGRVVEDDVSIIDIAPTVLDLLGVSPEARFEGQSLAPLLRGGATTGATRDVVLQLPVSSRWNQLSHANGMIHQREKVLVDPKGGVELFDLASDPGELHPRDDSERRTELLSRLTETEADLVRRAQASGAHEPIDAATRERLRALGYNE